MTTKSTRSDQLGDFLSARRAALEPTDVGLPRTGDRRRVRGLRREEVAQLASISTDYYTRIEQGRTRASANVIAALAGALRLDDDQEAYLYELAGKRSPREQTRPSQEIHPLMARLLEQLRDVPAIVLGRFMDVLAWNPLAAALIMDFSQVPESERNYVRLLFTHPTMRYLYDDWDDVAPMCVAFLRMEAAENPDDPRLIELVRELSAQDAQFRRWWDGHYVSRDRSGTKTMLHPVVGTITLDWDTLTSTTDRDQRLVLWSAEPDTPSHKALQLLASTLGN